MKENDVRYIFYENRVIEFYGSFDRYKIRQTNRNITGLKQHRSEHNKITRSGQISIEKKLTSWLTATKIHNKYVSQEHSKNQRKPIFITLTLSDKTTLSHSEIQRNLLQNFIKQIKYHFGVQEVFWKAELQKNGNLHYHLIADHYIPYKAIQRRWNTIQEKAGLLETYKARYKRNNPPSTHIKAVEELDKSIAYVMKYVSKTENKGIINSRLYRFSNELSKLKPFSFSNTEENVPGFVSYLHKIAGDSYSTDFYTKINLKQPQQVESMPTKLQQMYVKYYSDVYQKIYDN